MMPRVVLTPLKVNGEHVPSGKNHHFALMTSPSSVMRANKPISGDNVVSKLGFQGP